MMKTRIFTQQNKKSTTRIVHRTDTGDTAGLKVTVPALTSHDANRNEGNFERFQGFGSPPGRF